jgi:hypothetical protein
MLDRTLIPPLYLLLPRVLAHLFDTLFFSLEFQNDEDDHDQISPSAKTCSDERLPEFQDTPTLLTLPPASPRPPDHLV